MKKGRKPLYFLFSPTYHPFNLTSEETMIPTLKMPLLEVTTDIVKKRVTAIIEAVSTGSCPELRSDFIAVAMQVAGRFDQADNSAFTKLIRAHIAADLIRAAQNFDGFGEVEFTVTDATNVPVNRMTYVTILANGRYVDMVGTSADIPQVYEAYLYTTTLAAMAHGYFRSIWGKTVGDNT